jgi:hypothetical protein
MGALMRIGSLFMKGLSTPPDEGRFFPEFARFFRPGCYSAERTASARNQRFELSRSQQHFVNHDT